MGKRERVWEDEEGEKRIKPLNCLNAESVLLVTPFGTHAPIIKSFEQMIPQMNRTPLSICNTGRLEGMFFKTTRINCLCVAFLQG